jgi:hypothetical protein
MFSELDVPARDGCLVSHSPSFDVERPNVGGYFLTKLPNCHILRSFYSLIYWNWISKG